MEHSTAIMEDAGRALEAAADRHTSAIESNASKRDRDRDGEHADSRHDNPRKKRKNDYPDARLRHGSQRGGRGGRRGGDRGHGDSSRHKKSDLGRGEYFRDSPDKRQKTNAFREKRLEGKGPEYGPQFSQEEIDAEQRRPKRKVAVLLGYSGTGYKGMQISASEKTIEGDLFNAFVAAGAISKANANDPKKVSLVRCARTDKGVHAAGNVISLQLIVEDSDIVSRINSHLSPQIRIWGIERTIGSFNCYQAVDSRWYEYLIPSYAFLPPHPSSWLASKLEGFADEAGDRAGYEARQAVVKGYWEDIDRNFIDPILAEVDEDIRADIIKALRGEDEDSPQASVPNGDDRGPIKLKTKGSAAENGTDSQRTEEAVIILDVPDSRSAADDHSNPDGTKQEPLVTDAGIGLVGTEAGPTPNDGVPSASEPIFPEASSEEVERLLRLRAATKRLRQAYTLAKRKYRLPSERIKRIQAALNKFVGTANYHNYTVQKTFRDPSAKRHIKSFVVNPKPILIGEGPDEDKSEWLSLKVHGQSFMMHQIRKMIGMITLLVRCGSDLSTMDTSFTDARISIPKVPGLGLLLERPVFDSYNENQAAKFDREKLDFGKFEEELEEFKQREIYQRIFREEEEKNEFGKFFNHIDNFKQPHFLWVTSLGLKATKGVSAPIAQDAAESDDGVDE